MAVKSAVPYAVPELVSVVVVVATRWRHSPARTGWWRRCWFPREVKVQPLNDSVTVPDHPAHITAVLALRVGGRAGSRWWRPTQGGDARDDRASPKSSGGRRIEEDALSTAFRAAMW
jgi:hypothetical protein